MCYSIIEQLNLGYEVLFFILGGVMCVCGGGGCGPVFASVGSGNIISV